MEKEITLSQFIAEQHAIINNFYSMWRAEYDKGNTQYPIKLLRGDWDEQLYNYWDETLQKRRGNLE